MGVVTSGIGAYTSIKGNRLGLTPDNQLVVGGQVMPTPYSALGAGVPYYCDPDNGDNNLSGRTPGTAVASLVTALGLTTAEQNDAVILIGDGNTSGTARLSANLDWNKDATHLVGIGAPNRQAKRTRISHDTSAATNFILFTVSADGCIFENFGMYMDIGQASTDETTVTITGRRSYFGGVSFEGLGDTNSASRAGSEIILLTAAEENRFVDCTFGLETVARSAANATLRFQTSCGRNSFEGCLFVMYATSIAPLWIDAPAANAFNGSSQYFKNCEFIETGLSGSSTPTVVGLSHSASNGTVYFTDCKMNAAAWAAASVRFQVSAGEKTANVYGNSA